MRLWKWLSRDTNVGVIEDDFVECAECGASVRSMDLERHSEACRSESKGRFGTLQDGQYASTKHGVSFGCPEDWAIHAEERMEETGTLVVQVGEKETDQDTCTLSVIVMEPRAREVGGVERYLRDTEAHFAKTLRGFKADFYKQTELQGYTAAWMEHSYDDGDSRVRELVLTAFVNHALFALPVRLVLKAPEARYGAALRAFKRILDTFHIANGGLTTNINMRIV